ncbi:HAD-IA family hydrolase [Celeribacter litoreus]|uniref:HAD-IA family hydrolase n=1 Tax=Celeribacter litoreus TaxID=2876714 RepID=UPI001CC976DF|nr:HAD-IA family hydrolase [Celeribacter litoreus]MCA0042452.1 HAD-IA family hydrolase [Celeribacter litoreus]
MKLVIFDVDGTLVDSQAYIIMSMSAAFAEAGRPAPDRGEILSIVGLSLPLAMRELAPDVDDETLGRMVEAYKSAFQKHRLAQGAAASPLYPGAEEMVRRLAGRGDLYLAIATGKSRRGLNALLDGWDFADVFVSTQSADEHPSKPHPSMVETCLMECGLEASDAVVIGDTTYDMEMAKAARCHAIGVNWGYHGPDALLTAGAVEVLSDFSALETALTRLWPELSKKDD